ncbi:hypothetical protein LG315_06705 [Microbacterium marinum]|uniref:hypothetical protein n=1 Tax=Microbacterium marinum TaxID=421115 RepID=UPI0038502E27
MRLRTALLGIGAIAVLLLSGCGVQMTDQEQFDQSQEANRVFKAAVGEVQLQVLDGDWVLSEEYGDVPWGCDGAGDHGTYWFSMGRATPDGWEAPAAPDEIVQRLGAWFDENGWTDIRTRTYDEGVDNQVIEASKADANVALVVVDLLIGEDSAHATVRAKSTCLPGDWMVISELQLPLGVEPDPIGPTEHPTDPPVFGYTEDGRPRYIE